MSVAGCVPSTISSSKIEDAALANDETDIANAADRLERVSGDCNQIGTLTNLNGADLLTTPK
jgi:hypothetical protein